jgi:DEAD/DEAH box helicase domain-containing protein
MKRDSNNELVTAITSKWPFLQQTEFRITPHLDGEVSDNAHNFVINVDRPSAAIESTLGSAKRRADLGSTTLVLTSSKYEAQIVVKSAKGRFGPDFALDLTDKISIKDMATLGSRRKLLVCTPEIIHRKILPDSFRFTRLLEAVSTVSLFDLSNFRGVLGSHLYYILKRLSIANEGNHLSFNATAIYLGNARSLFGAIIDSDPAECRELWMIDGIEIPCLTASVEAANAVASPSFLAASIGVQLEMSGLRTTVLTSSRSQAEVIAETITSISSHDGGTEIKPLLYRGGYIDEVRDDIREEIASGEFKVAVATSQLSLELPQSDLVIFLGIPKTIAQIRRNISTLSTNDSALVLLPDSDNLDQWVVRNINSINDRRDESAAINPQNPKVMEYQLLCAADETSIKPEQLSNDHQHQRLIQDLLEENQQQGKLVATESGHLFVGALRPSKVGGLRGGDNVTYTLITDDGELLEIFDSSRLFFNFYLGAIHRHRGRRFRVTDIDFDQRLVYCASESSKRYTKPRIESQYSLLKTIEKDESLEGLVSLSEIEVTEFFTGYDLLQGRGEVVEFVDYELEPKTLQSEALLFAIPFYLFSEIPISEYGAALHAFEHATIGVLSTVSLCDRWDVGGVSFVINGPYNNGVDIITNGGAIAIYDGSDGGSGVARASFARWRELLATSIQNLEECPCEDGCPSCIVSPKCGNSNSLLSKEHGRTLGRNLRGWLHAGR